ncbi:MAG: excinuclease ABC subunit UvrC [Bacilli bacterium]|nr:excinuclease ABC subunit UvrC [Bacilli bacterium]
MTEKIKNLISNLKHSPGVYLMHDKSGKVIYVGKAKDLYKRVSQYFLRPQVGKVAAMVSHVDYFETIIVSNEKESFVLEMNLIQTHYPRYNILLKDGSHYPYIALKKGDDLTLSIKRNNKDKKYDYFGPFPNSGAAYQMVDLLNKIYPIRKCQHIPSSPCLYYHLGQCLAPCINKIESNKYEVIRKELLDFLKGNNSKIRKELYTKMMDASEIENYELASEYKKLIDSIDHISTSQKVESSDKTDRDIFAYNTRNGYISLSILLYRKGKLLGKEVYVNEEGIEDISTTVGDLILQFYNRTPLPKEIVVNSNEIIDYLKPYLDVNFRIAQRGNLLELVSLCETNAKNALDEYFSTSLVKQENIDLLKKLQQLLKLQEIPYHIELFDNSHTQGSLPVGALVTYINGEKCKSLYRKFNITHEESRDDYASMKEIVTRHYLRNKTENKKMPDLILADGGVSQVHAIKEALKEIDINIPTFGLFKNEHHQTKGLIDENGLEYLLDDKNKQLFFLLTRMQDEVHRYAISFHIDKRSKAMKATFLDDIKGLGNKRKELIYMNYKDINELKNASIEELSQILPNDVATNLYNKIHNIT